jgi:hypothetical protein
VTDSRAGPSTATASRQGQAVPNRGHTLVAPAEGQSRQIRPCHQEAKATAVLQSFSCHSRYRITNGD